jgi:DNA-directed RNA polymerase subunit RPC12/RpoP
VLEKSQSPRTGLICIVCREPVAYVEQTTSRGLHIHCPACTHNWIAEDVTSHVFNGPLDIRRPGD